MKAIAALFGLTATLACVAGCDEATGPEAVDIACGQGEMILVASNTYCIFERAVVIETGFSCPEGTLPAEHEGNFICATPEGLEDSALSELSEALDAMADRLDRPDPVKPLASAGQAAMAGDERAADKADEAAAISEESSQKSFGTEEGSAN